MSGRIGYYERTEAQRIAQAERARKYPKETDSRSRLYQCWRAMLARCRNPKHEAFERYAGRGIIICSEWLSYAAFREWAAENGYRNDLQIDRRNNDGPYNPDNCWWRTTSQQSRNRRDNLPPVAAFGDLKTPIEWVEDPRCKVAYKLLYKRLAAGEPPESAMTRPSASPAEASRMRGKRSNKDTTPSPP